MKKSTYLLFFEGTLIIPSSTSGDQSALNDEDFFPPTTNDANPEYDGFEEELPVFRNSEYFDPTHDPNDFLSEDHENISQQMYNVRHVRMNDFDSGIENSGAVRL